MKKGIWKPAGENLIIYDQLCPQVYKQCGAHACTLVATVTSASNLTGLQLTNGQLGQLCADFVATGKFNLGQGAKVQDACPFALEWFNKTLGTSLKGSFTDLNVDTAIDTLSSGQGAVFGLRYNSNLQPDAQDNGLIDFPKEAAGSDFHHVVTFIKMNTTGGLIDCKFINSYNGRIYKNGQPFKNVIQFRLPDFLISCQRFLYTISK